MPPRSRKLRPVLLAAATLVAALALGAGAQAQSGASAPAHAAPVALRASGPSAGSTAAPADRGGPRWAELGNNQRKILAPLAADWNDGIDSRSKERWLDVAARFHKMPAEEQQRATQRMVEWAHMTVAERTRARANYQALRNVSREERDARWRAYQALPEEKKRELAKRAAAPASGASGPVVATRRRTPPPLGTVQPKTNVVGRAPAAAGSAPLIAAPSRPPGATTTLLTRRASPPPHQRDGQPKIAVGPNSVDRTTLLPKRPPSSSPQATVSAASTTAAPRP